MVFLTNYALSKSNTIDILTMFLTEKLFLYESSHDEGTYVSFVSFLHRYDIKSYYLLFNHIRVMF